MGRDTRLAEDGLKLAPTNNVVLLIPHTENVAALRNEPVAPQELLTGNRIQFVKKFFILITIKIGVILKSGRDKRSLEFLARLVRPFLPPNLRFDRILRRKLLRNKTLVH